MFLFVLVFVNFQVCFSQSSSFFRLENDNTVIKESIKPTLNESVTNELECYMKCLNNRGKCCLVQMKDEAANTSCTLYDIMFHKASLKRSAVQTKIVSVVGCAPKDCQTWYKSGYTKDRVYEIEVDGNRTKVFCDMTTDGGGWTIVQRRIDGSVDFDRKWDDYKKGFGDADGEYWLGNEFLHQLTKGRSDTLVRIEGMDFHGVSEFITMKGVSIASEGEKYQLSKGVFTSGNSSLVGNWNYHNGGYFTTRDRDNDNRASNCAIDFKSGWWYGSCFAMNPNGKYSEQEDLSSYSTGIMWAAWTGFYKSLKAIKIQIR